MRRLLTLRDLALMGSVVELATIPEAASLVGVTPQRVREWVRSGAVPYAQVGRRIVVPVHLVVAHELRTRRDVRERGGRPRGPTTEPPHGYARYRRGCPCSECRAANAARRRAERARLRTTRGGAV